MNRVGFGQSSFALKATGFTSKANSDDAMLALFAAGQQGAFYDPSDLTTLYQDAAGTIPVTADGDPVGLILDKSQGLTLGAELIKDGGLDAASANWAIGYNNANTFSEYVGGRLRFYTVGANTMFGYARQNIPTVIGTTYKVTVMADALNANIYNGATATIKAGSSAKTIGNNKAGELVVYFTATSTNTIVDLQGFTGNADAEVFFDNVSVKEIKGNHARQTVSASRPVYKTDGTKTWLYNDKVDDKLIVTLPGMTATVVTATDDGVTINYPVSIAAGNRDITSTSTLGLDYGRLIIDRELTADEKTQVTAYFNTKRGV